MILESIVGTAIATATPWLGEWAIVGLAGKLTEGAIRHFKPDQMALLLKQSIAAAQAAQPKTGALFDRCHYDGYKGVKNFLEQFFQSGEVLKELQKPLQDKGKPDLAILIAAFKESAKQHPEAKDYLLNSLQLWMETFVESYFEQTQGICFQVAKEQYLKQLARRVDDVKFVGIAVPGEEVEKQEVLAQIFVMPDVREEKIRNSRQLLTPLEEHLNEVRRQMMEGDMFDGNHLVGKNFELNANRSARVQKLTKQSLLLQEQKEWETRDRSAPRIPAQKVINLAQKKAVVLGAPGSGKTMLASYFALMLCETPQSDSTQIGLEKNADYLPIVVRIRDWILSPGMGLLEYLRSNAEASLACKELPTGFFEHWLERGRALILLDGLDEVVDEAQRRKVAEQIETFLHQYQDNPAVITSRPAGYRWDFFNLDEFPHYTLECFDDKQVATFIDHWYDSRLKDDPAQAERRKADLQKAFARNERIKLLAKNPLLLTIITLIHRYQAELPRQRYKLYEKAVETLLTSWDSGKEIKLYSQVLLFLKPDDLLYILKKLAYWIHTQGSTGDAEGGTLIDKDELIRWLRKEIQTLKKCEAHEAKGEAERFIDFIQKRTGLLNEQGRDRYAFVHKTFQEYLTAEEIFDRADVEDDTEIILTHFRQHLHDQHWREVLLLLVSKLKGKKAQKAIQAVLDAGSEYEQWLHRDLLFVGWCLTEDPPELSVVAADWVGEILDRLVSLEVGDSDQIGSKIQGEAGKIIHCFGETTVEQDVWAKLQAQGEQIDRIRLLEFHADLGGETEAINILFSLINIQSNIEDSTSFFDALSSEKLTLFFDALSSEELTLFFDAGIALWKRLFSIRTSSNLSSYLDNKEIYIRLGVSLLLIESGHTSNEVISCLLELLHSEQIGVSFMAALSFFQLSNASDEVISNLKLLLQHEEPDMRSIGATLLIKLSHASDEILNDVKLLLQDRDFEVRFDAAKTLLNVDSVSNEIVTCLQTLLQDKEFSVRFKAAQILSDLKYHNDNLVNNLHLLLQNKDENTRSIAALVLSGLGNSNNEVLSGLLLLLINPDSDVRSTAVTLLGKSGNTSSEVIGRLLFLLHDKNSEVRSKTVSALGQLGYASLEIVDSLLYLLDDPDSKVRSTTVFALSQLAKTSATICPRVVQWLEQNPNDDGIGSAIDCLWSIVVE